MFRSTLLNLISLFLAMCTCDRAVADSAACRELTGTLHIAGAAGSQGDYLLTNDYVSFVITRPDHPGNNMVSGGYVADAWVNTVEVDALGAMHLFLNDRYPRMAKFASLTPVPIGTDSSVSIVAKGVDSEDASIDITSTYTLQSNARVLHVETSVMATETTVPKYLLGDAVTLQGAEKVVAGQAVTADLKFFEAPWMGALTSKVAYAYWAEQHGNLWGPIGGTFLDANVTTVTLLPGKPMNFVRYLAVGESLADVAEAARTAKGIATAPLRGRLETAENSTKLDRDVVLRAVSEAGGIEWEGRIGEGEFELQIPRGKYRLMLTDYEGGTTAPEVSALADHGAPRATITATAGATIRVDIKDSQGKSTPGKLTIEGINGTADPVLGEAFGVPSGNIVYTAGGEQTVGVPAGEYRITLSRGTGYNMEQGNITLRPGQMAQVDAVLERAFDPAGAVTADFHLHMSNSPDSGVTLRDRVVSCLGEGLQVLVSTDHNWVTDYAPMLKELNAEEWATSIVGTEMTTRKHMFGHFNAFPVEPAAGKQGNGAIPFEGVTAAQLFASAHGQPGEQVVQINHARAAGIGYFDRLGLSVADGTTTHLNWSDKFTAMEVYNGKRRAQAEDMSHDWFNLLNMGYRITGTANSDTHHVHRAEPGYPRNYVFLAGREKGDFNISDVTSAEVVQAVADRHAVVCTNGPFIQFGTSTGEAMGSEQKMTSGPVEFDVRVEGANFVQPSKVELLGNGKVVQALDFSETTASLKWSGRLSDAPTSDTWYIVKVTGTASMVPVMAPGYKPGEDLVPTPYAITNPIWIDRDGNGRFDAPRADLYKMMSEDRATTAAQELERLTRESRVWRMPSAKAGGEN